MTADGAGIREVFLTDRLFGRLMYTLPVRLLWGPVRRPANVPVFP